MDYSKMSLEDLTEETQNLKAIIRDTKAKMKEVAKAKDYHFMVAKFEKMSDKEREAMKIYVEGFKSNGEFGEVS